jgi:hypothetical protein
VTQEAVMLLGAARQAARGLCDQHPKDRGEHHQKAGDCSTDEDAFHVVHAIYPNSRRRALTSWAEETSMYVNRRFILDQRRRNTLMSLRVSPAATPVLSN